MTSTGRMVIIPKEAKGLRTWVEIDTRALRHNFDIFKKVAGNAKLMAVAKSNAYGHGILPYARSMASFGVDWIGVDSITEAMTLRRGGINKPILVMGATLEENFKLAFQNDIHITISSIEGINRLHNAKKAHSQPSVHLKLDTGMHRQGLQFDELPHAIRLLSSILPHKNRKVIDGVYTHFGAAKNPSFPAETKKQVALFEKGAALLERAGFTMLKHAAATSGTLVFPDAKYDMVRIGIGLYGLWPSEEVQAYCQQDLQLEPVLSWRTVVSEIKGISAGERVGYDFTESVSKDTNVAVCPIGYWHGYPRLLSSVGHAVINGVRSRILGRVSMDMICLDVSAVPEINEGDAVTLIGKCGSEYIAASELAQLSGTTAYEIVTRLNPLMKRIYL